LVETYLLLVVGVAHQCGHTVLLDVVEVDLVRLFCRALFVMLDAGGGCYAQVD
jgi:hypothetical protein